MITAQEFQKGHFTYSDALGVRQVVPIDFNPAALDYSVSINARGLAGQAQQAAGVASATLNLELVFDTTDTGEDVRARTSPVERLLGPVDPAPPKGPPQAPPLVTFEWGAFTFRGVATSFRQSMDFFSANGVPLRAVVHLTLSQPNYEFDGAGGGGRPSNSADSFLLPDGNAAQVAVEAGDPTGARAIASANGLESLRANAGDTLAVSGSVTMGAPVAFATGATGGTTTTGALPEGFAQLQTHSPSADGTRLQPARLLATASAPSVAAGAVFDVTGRAVTSGSGGLRAPVNGSARLRFDEP